MRIKLPLVDDHWLAVMEIGTYNGRARAVAEVLPAQADQDPQRSCSQSRPRAQETPV